ncbi:Transcriptional regulatory protein LnrK [Austwickia sp. TVS 96-490-7B]|uniref:response regulator transcription factor n=1 Tax=Austwickia sp. TVS 96-490-7B TaxID=2830843 RepID=UPI001C5891B5|nr:response regulator transcription factor [Austwickia sp. TVS 96-490-7B]MBW3085006.1 Transcriptional regulatory protein LnrK [Austwickia sp. TVS 96-490-7B]
MSEDTPTVIIADDAALLREGLAGLLSRQGWQVITTVSRADTLTQAVTELAADGRLPDLCIIDVRMPPTMTNDGLLAALDIRRHHPDIALMVLSQYVAPTHAQQLLDLPARAGTGYLLKDRVADVTDFLASLRLMIGGGVVIDPDVARAMMSSRRAGLGDLTRRELHVLELMARGLSNGQIAAELVVSGAAVAKHVAGIFAKLGLDAGEDNRRVRAVLTFLAQRPFAADFPGH